MPEPAAASRGVFVVLEGGDGAGKSTQQRLLADWLAESGAEVVLTREPGGTPLGEQIRALLLHGDHVAARAEALLFAADRAHHVETVVRPALERGAVVVQDRYLDSSVAYQGAGRDLAADDVRRLSLWATHDLRPDLTVLLDVPPQVGAERRGGVHDRLEREGADFHERVRRGFLDLAEAEAHRYLVVDASLPADEIAGIVRERVAPLVGGAS
ncbi:dTMP kinase [Barrientosiimonas humi]|uniref:Thymidylate kinase n=1 Tax=Barrientosiimonas humi TaxID=999931 RepID=A0A542X7U6_9MICO|nr:dTMP kinase [Barrientosiimonas humi]TQL31908.1 dTMP kinase [Barrientosiimonas humi]CAG7571703.1 Thymidylate kinase [Barrientosiimonas humi]